MTPTFALVFVGLAFVNQKIFAHFIPYSVAVSIRFAQLRQSEFISIRPLPFAGTRREPYTVSGARKVCVGKDNPSDSLTFSSFTGRDDSPRHPC